MLYTETVCSSSALFAADQGSDTCAQAGACTRTYDSTPTGMGDAAARQDGDTKKKRNDFFHY